MSRIANVAVREYASTVTTKGFLVGMLIMPLLIVGAITLMTLGVDNVWSANVLMLFLALSELLGLGLRLIAYRRGA